MEHGHDNAVQERAYYLWLKEGSPEGRDTEFWERARLLQQAESAPSMATPLQERSAEEAAVDAAVAESFPASDPAAFASPTRLGNEPETPLTKPAS